MTNRVRVQADLENHVSPGVNQMQGDFKRLAGSPGAQSILQGVGLGAGVSAWGLLERGIGAVTDTIGRALDRASDMAETASKSEVVFGAAADAMSAWGDTAAEKMGMAKQAALEAAAGFGLFFTGAGKSQAEAADLSRSMVQLAADLASFNNLDPTETLQKLRSGLSGEAEPLRAVGVFLSDAKVKAKAAEMGLGGLHGELTEGEKILARYQVILDETGTAQGDFARTADGAANAQRTLDAKEADLEARLGERGLPLRKAWLEAQLALTDAVAAYIDHADGLTAAEEHYRTLGLQPTIRELEAYAQAHGIVDATGLRMGRTLRTEQTPAMADLGKSTGITTNALYGLPKAALPANRALEDLAAAVREAEGEVDDLTASLVDGLFGEAVRAGERQELTDRLKELRKELSTTTDKGDARILRGQIADLEGQLLQLDLTIAEAKGPAAAIETLETWRKKTGKLSEAQQQLYDDLRRVYRQAQLLETITFAGGGLVFTGIPTSTGKAGGGPVPPGWEGWVGEHGPEYVRMGARGGAYVHPAGPAAAVAAAGAGAGPLAPVVVQLALDGRVLASLVDDRLFYGAQAAGSSTRTR